MTPEQQAAIERLRELEAKATQGNWYKDEEFEQSLTALCRAENRKDILFGACDWEDADLICALRNEALLLIDALERDLKLAEIESAFHKNMSADLVSKKKALAADNERLRASHDKTHQMIDRIHAALDVPLAEMKQKIIAILDDEPLTELFGKTEQLEAERDALLAELDEKLDKELDFIADCELAIEKIGNERDALQARIDGALNELLFFSREEGEQNIAIDEAIDILKGASCE